MDAIRIVLAGVALQAAPQLTPRTPITSHSPRVNHVAAPARYEPLRGTKVAFCICIQFRVCPLKRTSLGLEPEFFSEYFRRELSSQLVGPEA